MSSGNPYERLYRVQATVNKMVLDGKRDPETVADVLQAVVNQSAEKFVLLADLGIITVPEDYRHDTRLASFSFRVRHQDDEFRPSPFQNPAITDANFPNPSRILLPGDKLHVRVFRQVVNLTTSSERMAFLETQKAVHVGVQGASLVLEQKRDTLPKGYSCCCFDKKKRLLKTARYHKMPVIVRMYDGDLQICLCTFEGPWCEEDALLDFCDVEGSLDA